MDFLFIFNWQPLFYMDFFRFWIGNHYIVWICYFACIFNWQPLLPETWLLEFWPIIDEIKFWSLARPAVPGQQVQLRLQYPKLFQFTISSRIQLNRQTGRQAGRQAGGQAEPQRDRRTDRQPDSQASPSPPYLEPLGDAGPAISTE